MQTWVQVGLRRRGGDLCRGLSESLSRGAVALRPLWSGSRRCGASFEQRALQTRHIRRPDPTTLLKYAVNDTGSQFRTTSASRLGSSFLQLRNDVLDFRNPHEWYPLCRSIKRRIIYHSGPTNSGKTHTALERLKQSKNGLYCAPLRLLAMEIYSTLNREGIYCNLLTGQERRSIPGACHTSATVEMIHLHRHYDVAVIDEIQLMGDEDRAFAWTRALHGLSANELHLCGDPSAFELVQKICHEMKEDVELHECQRFTPLEMESETVESYAAVQPGDCVVAFSRTEIYQIKQIIEYNTRYKVAVVYGALPPEVRRKQAELFNTPGNGYEVMVATDAVGMGLNLNIRRIVFHSLTKFDGEESREIPMAQIKQISGRAGRRNSAYDVGRVTCFAASDMPVAMAALQLPVKQLLTPKAGLFPETAHLEQISRHLQTQDLTEILAKMEEKAQLDPLYFLCKSRSMCEIAAAIQKVPLSLQDRLSFCMAPVKTSEPSAMAAVTEYATVYSNGSPVLPRVKIPEEAPLFLHQLRALESAYQIASLWMWLSYRLGRDQFSNRKKTEEQLHRIAELFDVGLQRIVVPSRLEHVVHPSRPPVLNRAAVLKGDAVDSSIANRERQAKRLIPVIE